MGDAIYDFDWDLWLYYLRKRRHLLVLAEDVLRKARLANDSGLTREECDSIHEVLQMISVLEDFILLAHDGGHTSRYELMNTVYLGWKRNGFIKQGVANQDRSMLNALDKFSTHMDSRTSTLCQFYLFSEIHALTLPCVYRDVSRD